MFWRLFPSAAGGTNFLGMNRKPAPVPMATNDEIARYFGVGDDLRRAIMTKLGLPKRRCTAWSEIWVRLGLEPVQPDEIRAHLMLGPENRNALWNSARVAVETGRAPDTVNARCRRNWFGDGFPRPILDFSAKTRLWLPLDVRAYVEPTIYGGLAAKVRRRGTRGQAQAAAPLVLNSTLQPLPPMEKSASA